MPGLLGYSPKLTKAATNGLGLLSAAVPSPYGDVLGLAADAAGYAQDPKSLTLGRGLLSLAALMPGIPSARTYYHGGSIVGDIKPGLFLSADKGVAEHFVKSHSKGRVYEFSLPKNAKVYPDPVWWQDYASTFGGPSAYKKMGYDVVRVIEPNGAAESLSVVNPKILRDQSP